jgi:hypothetical protein
VQREIGNAAKFVTADNRLLYAVGTGECHFDKLLPDTRDWQYSADVIVLSENQIKQIKRTVQPRMPMEFSISRDGNNQTHEIRAIIRRKKVHDRWVFPVYWRLGDKWRVSYNGEEFETDAEIAVKLEESESDSEVTKYFYQRKMEMAHVQFERLDGTAELL